eukprot:TRINITY_DN3239_c0_g1_i1.p1 TRINITY_DN3239_c0_g1~~TRINITY_DN3239_c0_g1_i1.p1  ORF type:complete len:246 (-),score=42.85 TRINITY_DN3239_c0_g1_i1:69-806(-)
MVEFLLSLPTRPRIDFLGRRGENALCSAIANGHNEIVSLLMKHGANVNRETPFIDGSAFLLAILMDNYEVVKQMVNSKKVNWDIMASIPLELEGKVNSLGGLSAIHLAVLVRNVDLLQLLLQNAPKHLINIQCEVQQVSPLTYAVLCGEDEIVRELLNHKPRLDLRTSYGRTAMDYAYMSKGSNEAVYDMLCNHLEPAIPDAISIVNEHLDLGHRRVSNLESQKRRKKRGGKKRRQKENNVSVCF